MVLTLRPAERRDIDVLEHWDEQPHVLTAIGGEAFYDWNIELPNRQPWRELLIAEQSGECDSLPVAFVQILNTFEEPEGYWAPVTPGQRALDIWIGDKANLSRGFGTRIMTLALQRCFRDRAVTGVLVDPLASNTDAIRFYRRLGFNDLGLRTFDDDDTLCRVLEMTRLQYGQFGTRSASR